MKNSRFTISLFSIFIILMLTVLPITTWVSADVIDTPPTPLTPIAGEYWIGKLPVFSFTQTPGIYKYRVKVTDMITNEIVYIYKNVAACPGDNTCWLQPVISLKPVDLSGNKGFYKWEVAARLDVGWTNYSPPAEFRVLIGQFTSTFTADYKKWLPVVGNWVITSTGTLKNKGDQYVWTSMVQKQLFATDTVYEARIKLKSVDPSHFGGIIVGGDPDPSGMNMMWKNGYYVMIANNKTAAILAMKEGVLSVPVDWASCPDIVPDDWNLLKVIVRDDLTTLDVYINNVLWRTINPAGGIREGYLGLNNYQIAAEHEPLQVDWVTASPYD